MSNPMYPGPCILPFSVPGGAILLAANLASAATSSSPPGDTGWAFTSAGAVTLTNQPWVNAAPPTGTKYQKYLSGCCGGCYAWVFPDGIIAATASGGGAFGGGADPLVVIPSATSFGLSITSQIVAGLCQYRIQANFFACMMSPSALPPPLNCLTIGPIANYISGDSGWLAASAVAGVHTFTLNSTSATILNTGTLTVTLPPLA